MPKKKTQSKRTKAKRGIHKDIAQAVERIPTMIAEEMHMIPTETSTQSSTGFYIQPNRSRLLLWIGVGTVTLSIFAMWIMNAKAMFYDIQHTKSMEGELFADAKDDIDTIFSGGPQKPTQQPVTTEPVATPETTEAIKQTLQAIFAGTAANTATTTEDKLE